MELSPEQSTALDVISTWLRDRQKPWLYLTGPAGTGKTTLAKHIAASHNGPVVGMAYTGKAAQVLTRKGLPSSTIHSKIYLPSTERKEEAEALQLDLDACTDESKARKIRKRLEDLNSPTFVLRPTSPFAPNTLIICDEVSMVSKTEAEDLLSFGCPVLVLGDDFQLPPIDGKGYFYGKPDLQLQTIHRQATESPIIRLATMAREGRPLPMGRHGDSLVTTRTKITKEIALSCSQIICGSNKARKDLNLDMRRFQNFTSPLPQAGERLICLRNNPKDGLLNGQMIDLAEDVIDHGERMVTVKSTEGHYVMAHKKCFNAPDEIKSWTYQNRSQANEFDWGFACTIHKFQGSQAPRILVWDDLWKWDKSMHAKILYTGITRAENSVVVAL